MGACELRERDSATHSYKIKIRPSYSCTVILVISYQGDQVSLISYFMYVSLMRKLPPIIPYTSVLYSVLQEDLVLYFTEGYPYPDNIKYSNIVRIPGTGTGYTVLPGTRYPVPGYP